jgi:Mn2+/Fe2+ NRAMP family transporter
MSAPVEDRDVVPVPSVTQPVLPVRPRSIHAGLRLRIHGREVHLRRLRAAPTGPLRWFALLGPGLIAAVAGDDAGGIATYSAVGAKFGYDLLWVLLLITLSLAVVQEMCSRLGAATGRGLLDLIRERYGLAWALLAVTAILLANGSLVVTELAGIGAAAEIFGVSRYLAVPLAAVVLWLLVTSGSYGRVEKVLVVMSLVFFAYPAAAVLARPDWGAVTRGALIPTLHSDPDYLLLFVGLIGTTITPYMQLFQQSATVEKGVARRHYGDERLDAYGGAIFSNVIAAFIIIATGATLHAAGTTEIETAADAAEALRPAAGEAALWLFAVGLLGASLLAGAVLPLATAYSVSEAFGFRKGVNLDYRRAPIFVALFSALILGGAAVALIPGVPLMALLVGVQVLNGVLLPVMLVFILLLINDQHLTRELANTRLSNVLGWGTFAFVTVAVVALLGTQLLGLVGIDPLGSG